MELENYTKEVNGIEYNVKIVYDDMPDLSWLGELTDKIPERNFVDIEKGVFIGDFGTWIHDFTLETFEGDSWDDVQDSDIIGALEIEYPDLSEFEIYGMDRMYDCWRVEFNAYQILADVPNRYWSRRDHWRYWVSCNHLNPDVKKDYIEKWGFDALLDYTIQDYKRHFDYLLDRWCMTGIIVELGDISESLWGIESDVDDDYKESTINDLIYRVNQRVPDYVQELRERANHLESILTLSE